jgi:ABC-type cobalamin/Fe3+-siderophores transport system ATPase subunit
VLHDGRVAAHGAAGEVIRAEVLAPVYGVEMETIRRDSSIPAVLPKLQA